MRNSEPKKIMKSRKPGGEESPTVDELVSRIATALGPDVWMTRMMVRPETVRTWRKRGAIPLAQLHRAADLCGVTVEHLVSSAEPVPDTRNFFAGTAKQISLTAGERTPEEAHPAWSVGTQSGASRLRDSTRALVRIAKEVGYEPAMAWTALIHELMFSHGLSETGALRIIETLKDERRPS